MKYNNKFYNENTKNEYYNYSFEEYQKKLDNLYTSPLRYEGETFACQFNWQFYYSYKINNIQKKLKRYPTYQLFKNFYKKTNYNLYSGYDKCPVCNIFFNYKSKHRDCGVLVRINYGEKYYFEYPEKCNCELICLCN